MRIRAALALAPLVLACSGAAPEAGDTADDVAPLLAGDQLSEAEVADILSAVGFERSVIPQMVCTAKWESSFYTEALHRNHNGSSDYGLFQVNDDLWARNCGDTTKQLYDPHRNALCAKKIYDYGGLHQWYGYLHHKTECDRYRLP